MSSNMFGNTVFPVCFLVPTDTAVFDVTDPTNDIQTATTGMLAVLSVVSGVLYIDSKDGAYGMQGDGMELKPEEGQQDNLMNPELKFVGKMNVVAPDGVEAADVTLRSAFLAVNSAATYDAYYVDPHSSGTGGYAARQANCKVKCLPGVDGLGKNIYVVTTTSVNAGEFTSGWLPQTYTS